MSAEVVRRARQAYRSIGDPRPAITIRQDYRGPTPDQVIVAAVGEPTGFDHAWYRLARRVVDRDRPAASDAMPPGPEFGMDPTGVARRV